MVSREQLAAVVNPLHAEGHSWRCGPRECAGLCLRHERGDGVLLNDRVELHRGVLEGLFLLLLLPILLVPARLVIFILFTSITAHTPQLGNISHRHFDATASTCASVVMHEDRISRSRKSCSTGPQQAGNTHRQVSAHQRPLKSSFPLFIHTLKLINA